MKKIFKDNYSPIWIEWKNNSKAIIMLILYLVCGTFFTIANTSYMAIFTGVLGYAIHHKDAIQWIIIGLAAYTFLRASVSICEAYFEVKANSLIQTSSTNHLMRKIMYAPAYIFEHEPCATFYGALSFVGIIEHYGMRFAHIWRMIVSLITSLIGITWIGGYKTLLLLSGFVVGICLVSILYRRLVSIDEKETDLDKQRTTAIEDSVCGYKERFIFNLSEKFIDKIDNLTKAIINETVIPRMKLNMIISACLELLPELTIVGVIAYFINDICDGTMTIASLLVLISFINQAINPMLNLINIARMLSSGMGRKKLWTQVMDVPEERLNEESKLTLNKINSIELKNVSIAYRNSENDNLNVAVSNVNISLEPGKIYAFYGESGSGKSSVAKLLDKFILPYNGEYLINGIDAKLYSSESFANSFTMISQEIELFDTSIYDNIKLAKDTATNEQIVKAAHYACLDELLNCEYTELSSTLKGNNEVGRRGLKLSGGQRQAVGIARALLRNAKVYIVDEGTSALDEATQAKVMKSLLKRVKNGGIVILIAHRLSTIENADYFYGFNNGRIVEEGTKDDLMNSPNSILYKLKNVLKEK